MIINQAQLVSPSVALPAQLVSHFYPSSIFSKKECFDQKTYFAKVDGSARKRAAGVAGGEVVPTAKVVFCTKNINV